MSTTITVQLDTLQAGRIRDIDQDQLAAIFVVYVDNHPVGAVAGYLSEEMRPGDMLSFGDFTPDNAKAWSLSVALDESNPAAQLGFLVLVHNIRGIDTAVVQHYLARGACALSAIAADVLLPQDMPVLTAAASGSGLIAEALGNEIIEKLFKAPQDCAGPVFAYHTPGQAMVDLLKRAETADNLIAQIETVDIWRLAQGPVASQPLATADPVKDTARQPAPRYRLNFSLIVDASYEQDEQNPVLTSGIVPASDATLDNWIGKRHNRCATGQIPSIFCQIQPSQTQPDGLSIHIEELLEGTSEVIFSKSYDGILPGTGKVILHGSDVLARRRVGPLMPQQRPYVAHEPVMPGFTPGRLKLEWPGTDFPAAGQGGALSGASSSASTSGEQAEYGTGSSLHAAPRGDFIAAHLIEMVDCIVLDDAKTTLALYVERQGNAVLGYAIRYMRPTDLLWTRVDAMLFVNNLSH